MNIFVLNTGRCASKTFSIACDHMDNYSNGHETLSRIIGERRLIYPDNHIEVDNRISWFLGELDEKYGKEAFYVHLIRDENSTAQSYAKRTFQGSIIRAYAESILMQGDVEGLDEDVLFKIYKYYVHTVNSNIQLFLKNKPQKMLMRLENIKDDFKLFWKAINAEGNLSAALKEWDNKYNASAKLEDINNKKSGIFNRIFK